MFRPRMTADRLGALYGTAAAALAAGDFYTALRLAGGEPAVEGIALCMLGNERRGLARLESTDGGEPAVGLVRALALWLQGDDTAARAEARALVARHTGFAPAAALAAAMAVDRPHIVYACTAANTLAAADALKASDAARVTVLRNVPHKADIAFGPATPAAALAQAVGEGIDCVLIDNLIMLPPQLAAIAAPKIAQCFDIEFFYAQRARELGWIDLILCPGNAMDHAAARIRFGAPALMRAFALDELMQADPAPLCAARVGAAADRPIDVLATGGVDKPFFPDKQHRFADLAMADPALDIRVIGRYLPAERYRALTGRAKYVLASNRASSAVTARVIDALCAGTMVACQRDEALGLLLGDDLVGVHCYRDGHVAADVARMVADYDRNRTAFVAGAARLAVALGALLPGPEAVARRSLRTLVFWSQMIRRGLGWASVVGAGAVPVRAAVALPQPSDCYAAKQESWLGLPGPLRGKLLAPLAAAEAAALAMPRLGQAVTAQAFLALNRLDCDLYRRQDEGVRAACLPILRTLNRARRAHPRSLTTWFLIGRHLAAVGRPAAAMRVLDALVARAGALELEERFLVAGDGYEVADWPLVDALMRDDLARHAPALFGAERGLVRAWLFGRAHALLASLHAARGDAAAFAGHAARAAALAPGDAAVWETALSGGVLAWQADGDATHLARALYAYLRAGRLSLRLQLDRFPEALEIAALLRRPGLGRLMVRRWLLAKSRLRLDAEEPVVTADERFVFARHGALFRDAGRALGRCRAVGMLLADLDAGSNADAA
ncbi:MAG: hypothetical protein R3F55_23470 [Alphaproteobacteria bacterium]